MNRRFLVLVRVGLVLLAFLALSRHCPSPLGSLSQSVWEKALSLEAAQAVFGISEEDAIAVFSSEENEVAL